LFILEEMATVYTGNDTTLTDHIFGTQDTIISDSDDAEFLSGFTNYILQFVDVL